MDRKSMPTEPWITKKVLEIDSQAVLQKRR